MTQVIKVSKSGKNVLTETDRNNFIFDSTVNTFKIITRGTSTGTITADGQIISVAHSQSVTPAVYAFCKYPDGYVALPGESDRAFTGGGVRYWRVEVDGTNMNFIFNEGGGGTYDPIIRYYVFETPI